MQDIIVAGIALAFIAAAKGYKLKCVMPDAYSVERRVLMLALGAEVILTSKEAGLAVSLSWTTSWLLAHVWEFKANIIPLLPLILFTKKKLTKMATSYRAPDSLCLLIVTHGCDPMWAGSVDREMCRVSWTRQRSFWRRTHL